MMTSSINKKNAPSNNIGSPIASAKYAPNSLLPQETQCKPKLESGAFMDNLYFYYYLDIMKTDRNITCL